jgi:hypothetical protein
MASDAALIMRRHSPWTCHLRYQLGVVFKLRHSFFILLAALAVLVAGCRGSSQLRKPNGVEFEFDSEKVTLLKWAAENKILFQFPETTFADVSSQSVQENCKKLGEPEWAQIALKTLSLLKKNSSLQNKVHVIEIKQGDLPRAEISKDLDGLTYLSLTYKRLETKANIENIGQVPCENKTSLYIGETLLTVSFEPPQSAMISKALKDLPTRSTPDRWKFNPDFLVHLAQKLTLFNYSSDLGFERSANGEFFLLRFLEEQASAIKDSKLNSFDYWLAEITQRSHSGSYLKILALISDKELSYGLHSSQNSRGMAYPFMSYRPNNGGYENTSLAQLNQCLERLSSQYKRGLASVRSEYSTQPESFLSPGHVCSQPQK